MVADILLVNKLVELGYMQMVKRSDRFLEALRY